MSMSSRAVVQGQEQRQGDSVHAADANSASLTRNAILTSNGWRAAGVRRGSSLLNRLAASDGQAGKTARFIRHAWERRVHKERFIDAGKTPYQRIAGDDIMEVRYYPPQDSGAFQIDHDEVVPVQARHRVPVLLVPPLGVYGWVYDLMAERSWVRFLNALGFDVYLVDWGAPQRAQASDLTLENYVNRWMVQAVGAVQEHSGEKEISLVGYCMGGLLCLLYTAAHGDGQVKNLVTIASPIDFHANPGGGKVLQIVNSGANKLGIKKVARATRRVAPENFHVSGEILSVLFKLTDPFSSVFSYFDLVRHLSDREYVKSHLTMYEWFNNMVDYPGATVQRLVFDFGFGNELASGQVRLGDQLADLRKIRSNYLAFAGSSDLIVGVAAAHKGMELLGSEDKTFRIVPGGHAGVFAGGRAKAHTWAQTAEWLADRSA
ncbi:Putative poly(R)-hydroxyalkanoic acid synthase (Pha) [gamma proteobacterium HdN1]|nr:Putative poly(R)-hydroxyalkanoic acid synthase (Pha) [gamma proteobacterium HdN1]